MLDMLLTFFVLLLYKGLNFYLFFCYGKRSILKLLGVSKIEKIKNRVSEFAGTGYRKNLKKENTKPGLPEKPSYSTFPTTRNSGYPKNRATQETAKPGYQIFF